MARRKISEVERNLMKEVSKNLRGLLKRNKWTQKELADKVGLSTSVISDYLNEKTLPTPGSIQMLAEAFEVAKGDIDPTFEIKNSPKSVEAKLKFFEDLERDLNVDFSDPEIQKMIKKAAKVIFSSED